MKEFKPEACYTKTDMYHTDITIGTAVVGTATRFDTQRRQVVVDLGYPWKGIIPEDEVSIYAFTYPVGKSTPHQIIQVIGKRIRAIVTNIVGEHTVILSRKKSMDEAWQELIEDTDYTACVTSNIGCGVFLDIGNGLVSYLYKRECSVTRVSDTRNWFEIGETVCVRILDKGTDESQRITCSRKMTETDKPNAGDVVAVRIGEKSPLLKEGYFCEVTPSISGIIDTKEKLHEGEIVKGVVKGFNESGAKLRCV